MDDLMLVSAATARSRRGRKLKIGMAALVGGGLITLVAMPSRAALPLPKVTAMACVGSSSVSGGGWTFNAGNGSLPPNSGTACSLATTVSPALDFEYESLAAAFVHLSGTGTLSCATGSGTVTSPSLAAETATLSSANFVGSGVGGYAHTDNAAFIVWSAVFTRGVGTLTGTLYGSSGGDTPGPLDPSATPEKVSGNAALKCGLSRALVVLHFTSMPPTR